MPEAGQAGQAGAGHGDQAELPEALDLARRQPDSAGVFLDFDGTLAPIVEDPGAARPALGASEALGALGRRLARVTVISGRPGQFLVERLGRHDGVQLLGLYGMERVDAQGRVVVAPEVEPWLPVVDAVRREAEDEAPPGLRVEPKTVSLTLHWREQPVHEAWAHRFVEKAMRHSGLVVQPGRMALELRPPVAVDKGTVVRRLGAGLRSVTYLGDDLGDLAAFAALDDLAAAGAVVAKVAVVDAESPSEVAAAADYVVESPAEAVVMLRRLAEGS